MIITHGSNPSQVALTFDDGPNVDTWKLLRVLNRYNAKATFFLLGKWVKQHRDICLAIDREGHEIGNHTMTHPALGNLTINQIENEIYAAHKEIVNACGAHPKFFRPPYGQASQMVDQVLQPTGMNVVMWSQMSGDWAAESSDEILSKINLDTDKGEIILLHDGGPFSLGADRSHTVEAVERLLAANRDKKFVTVSELTL